MVYNGKITDATTMVALMLLKDLHKVPNAAH